MIDGAVADPAAGATPRHRGRDRRHPLEAVGLISLLLFALLSVGSPLWGGSVLAATDELSTVSPYFDAGLAGTQVRNQYMDDTFDAVIPDTVLFSDQLRDGHVARWNPYVMGGVPLAAVPTLALLSPLTVPYYLLPGPLAPGYAKLLEILFAAGMTLLFLRRLGLGRPAALLGGTVFAGSGFMVVWTNWPHTRTAAFIPALFWALERLVQRRTARDAVLVALAVAGLLAGGFPAVTAFALYTAAPYLVVRVLASHRGRPRRVAGVLAAAGAALAAGFALLAVQLLPFARMLSLDLVRGRVQSGGDHVPLGALVTTVAPFALGSVDPARPPAWNLHTNLVESTLYLGAAATVLLVVALATPGVVRRILPPGAFGFLVVASAAWLAAIYTRPGALAVHHLPVFASNFVGRGRSVLGLLLAALAATGLEVLLRGRAAARAGSGRDTAGGRLARVLRRWWGPAVWTGFVAASAIVLLWAAQAVQRSATDAGDLAFRLANLHRQALFGGLLLAGSALAAALVWWGPGRTGPEGARRGARTVAAATLTVLAALQSGVFAWQYLPHAERRTFYPVTATHAYLAQHLGHDRFAATGMTMFRGASSVYRLRSLGGHAYQDSAWSQLVEGLPGRQLTWPTYLAVRATAATAASPILDRTAVRYLVTSPRTPVFGQPHSPDEIDGTTLVTASGTAMPVKVAGRLRAVTLIPAGPLPALDARAALDVRLVDAAGRTVATTRRMLAGLRAEVPFEIPLAAEDVPAGRLTVHLRLVDGPAGGVPFYAAPDGHPAAGTITADPSDGLRLVQAGPATIWERLTALPRIRWAAHARVVPGRRQVAELAAGRVPADTVLLNAPAGPAEGRPATVTPTRDGTDEIDVSVRADGAGYLVIADAIRGQWAATLDGQPVPLVAADHGLAAVAVPSGRHDVRVRYRAPYAGAGAAVSLLTLAVLVLVGLLSGRRRPGTRARLRGARPGRHGAAAAGRAGPLPRTPPADDRAPATAGRPNWTR